MATTRTRDDFDPEEIEHIRSTPVGKLSLVIRTYLTGNFTLDGLIFAENFRTVMNGKRVAHKEIRNGIDIAADDPGTEFGRFTKRCSTSHERVENNRAFQADRPIEGIENIGAAWCKSAKNDRAKNRTKPMRPPFMNMVEGTIDFFPPTFQLRDVADLLEWKRIVLKSTTAGKRPQINRDVIGKRKVETPLVLYAV